MRENEPRAVSPLSPNILSPPTSPLDVAKYKNPPDDIGGKGGERQDNPASSEGRFQSSAHHNDDGDEKCFNFDANAGLELSDTESSEAFKGQVEGEEDREGPRDETEGESLPEDDGGQRGEREESVPPPPEPLVSHESLMDAYISEARRKTEELRELSTSLRPKVFTYTSSFKSG